MRAYTHSPTLPHLVLPAPRRRVRGAGRRLRGGGGAGAHEWRLAGRRVPVRHRRRVDACGVRCPAVSLIGVC